VLWVREEKKKKKGQDFTCGVRLVWFSREIVGGVYTSGDIRYEREGRWGGERGQVRYVELEYLVVYSYGTVHILRKSFSGWIFYEVACMGNSPCEVVRGCG